jgi:restriction system protein
VAALLVGSHPQASMIVLAIVFAAAGAVFLAPALWRAHRRRLAHEVIDRRLTEGLSIHAPALVAGYLRLRRQDSFGGIDESAWLKEINRFFRACLVDWDDRQHRAWSGTPHYLTWVDRVKQFAAAKSAERAADDESVHADAELFSPRQYELHCAKILQAAGWQTQPTPPTRDSGADVIAEKGRWRVAIECKRYGEPVGNRAVQQVYTAKSLYRAEAACVVAPNGFTAQAEREAYALGVVLLHHSELGGLEQRLEGSRLKRAV